MTGERCRHCGGAIEYIEYGWVNGEVTGDSWWRHIPTMQTCTTTWDHEAAPAFGGGS